MRQKTRSGVQHWVVNKHTSKSGRKFKFGQPVEQPSSPGGLIHHFVIRKHHAVAATLAVRRPNLPYDIPTAMVTTRLQSILAMSREFEAPNLLTL